MTTVATYPPEVAPLIDALREGVEFSLGESFVGMYLCGSLALGGFDPQTSDVDVLIVTKRPVSDDEFTAIRALHTRIPVEGNDYGFGYDIYYIDADTIRRFAPGLQHVKTGPGEPLHRGEHRPNWVLERWVVREHGVAIAGPDPKTLIDYVPPDDLRRAAAGELRERLRNWSDGNWPRQELAHRGAQAFEIETVCRAFNTIETGEITTKNDALLWALTSLPEQWHSLIEWANAHSRDLTKDETKVSDALTFLAWAVSETSR
jgi:hypothetical protein